MADADYWPQNVVDVLVGEDAELLDVIGVEAVIDRPVDPSDANGTVGLYAMQWLPPEDAFEIGRNFPTRNVYTYGLDFMTRGLDRAAARRQMAAVTKRLRAMLYHDAALEVRLEALSETFDGVTEVFSRIRVTKQDYEMGQLGDTHLAASHTTITVTTENI